MHWDGIGIQPKAEKSKLKVKQFSKQILVHVVPEYGFMVGEAIVLPPWSRFLNCLILTAWKSNSHTVNNVKGAMDALDWEYDHDNPYGIECKKGWQNQSHKNKLAKNTMEAFGWKYVSDLYYTIPVP